MFLSREIESTMRSKSWFIKLPSRKKELFSCRAGIGETPMPHSYARPPGARLTLRGIGVPPMKHGSDTHATIHRKNKIGGENSTVLFRIFRKCDDQPLKFDQMVKRSTSLNRSRQRHGQCLGVPQKNAVYPSRGIAGRQRNPARGCATYAVSMTRFAWSA